MDLKNDAEFGLSKMLTSLAAQNWYPDRTG